MEVGEERREGGRKIAREGEREPHPQIPFHITFVWASKDERKIWGGGRGEERTHSR